MSNLPRDPKPHIGEKVDKAFPKISPSDRKKAIREMTEIIQESNKIIKRHRSSHNETLYK